MQKHLSPREHPSCLFSCCFRTFSISLERFLRSFRLTLPLSFSRQITDESCRGKRKARKPHVLSLSRSPSFCPILNTSSGNFRFDVFVCLLRTINELQAQHSVQRACINSTIDLLYVARRSSSLFLHWLRLHSRCNIVLINFIVFAWWNYLYRFCSAHCARNIPKNAKNIQSAKSDKLAES